MPVEGRMLKAKISLNESLANLKDDTHRLLFTWAIPHLDRDGRISGSPRVFKATVCPLLDHLTPKKIQDFFFDAHEHGLITYYEADGAWWLEYPKFRDNQKIKEDRETPSRIPPPPENSGELPRTPDNLLSPPPEVKRREVKRREYTRDFLNFYDAYPRKINKEGALKEWQKLSENGGLPAIDILLDAIEQQKTWGTFDTEPKFIVYPERWLKFKRWEDKKPQPVQTKKCPHDLWPEDCRICKDYIKRPQAGAP